MINLLRANFYELFRSRFFYIIMAACSILAAFLAVAVFTLPFEVDVPESTAFCDNSSLLMNILPSFVSMILPFASASIVAILLDSQYNQGNVRNKLISGHTRTEVFLSNLITSCIPTVIYFVIYEVITFGIAIFIFGYDGFKLIPALVTLGVLLLMLIVVGVVLSFTIGHLIRSRKTPIILLVLQYALNASMVLGMYKGENKFCEIASRFFPQSNLFTFTYTEIPDTIEQSLSVSLIVAVVLIVFGLMSFKKSDIK